MLMLTKKELASAYCIHRNTLTKRLNEIGVKKSGRLSPRELALIFEELGRPELIKKPINIDRFKDVG